MLEFGGEILTPLQGGYIVCLILPGREAPLSEDHLQPFDTDGLKRRVGHEWYKTLFTHEAPSLIAY